MKARDFIDRSNLLQIVVANIRDGRKIGAHDHRFAKVVAERTKRRLASKIADGKAPPVPLDEDILGALEDVCFGVGTPAPGKYIRRPGSRYLMRHQPSCPVADDWYSSVTTLGDFERLVPDSEWRRMFGTLADKTGNPSYDPLIMDVLKPNWKGSFKVAPDFTFGNPLAWFTPRTELRNAIDGKTSLADAARDWLGLIHRAEPTHLVTLHFPASVLSVLRSARPTFADAGRHSRFMLAAADLPPPYGVEWGQTLALDLFALNEELADGAKERVFSRVTAADLGGLSIGVTYLGALTETRGVAPPAGSGKPAKSFIGSHADFAGLQIKRDPLAFEQTADSL